MNSEDKSLIAASRLGELLSTQTLEKLVGYAVHTGQTISVVLEKSLWFLPPTREQLEYTENTRLREILNRSVDTLGFSVRVANCLKVANITTVGQLSTRTERDVLKYDNFGRKSLYEVYQKLQDVGLALGMKFEKGLVDPINEH